MISISCRTIVFDWNFKMTVLFFLFLVVGSAIAAGSGPYAPRGWKPDGPAFTLPGEDELKQKLEEKPSPDDEFKEYGPPKLEVLDKQELPEVQTIRTFEQQRVEENEESTNNSNEISATEKLEEDMTTASLGEINDDSSREVSTDLPVENPGELQPVEKTEDQINNMAYEMQLISEQNENDALQKFEQLKVNENSASLEGFREYGPPGFEEYGPPKEPQLPESNQEIEDERKRRSLVPLYLYQHQQRL